MTQGGVERVKVGSWTLRGVKDGVTAGLMTSQGDVGAIMGVSWASRSVRDVDDDAAGHTKSQGDVDAYTRLSNVGWPSRGVKDVDDGTAGRMTSQGDAGVVTDEGWPSRRVRDVDDGSAGRMTPQGDADVDNAVKIETETGGTSSS